MCVVDTYQSYALHIICRRVYLLPSWSLAWLSWFVHIDFLCLCRGERLSKSAIGSIKFGKWLWRVTKYERMALLSETWHLNTFTYDGICGDKELCYKCCKYTEL